ncbi:ATP-dependent RNA helicase RhlB [Sedimenticola selenatireducens]|uniref:ATP-dependent RNA helicase RhlB n=1 Tax=Sedimenticola selenatireducens TaxID=191960 RepID=A0A557S4X2_9GAMM|nr:ATP-dependent RNA helicase RhlB [Sedimenticola selenatireducens]TVO72397.1 ATP-dependent RNA helicase RhlB [Sedimenticola selenatireducens]TVT64652.1 MAG: ATP-dependent RNA helicase RhlB [Sedimenticola selenatireducens]
MTDKHLTDIRFDSLALCKELAQGIEDTGFSLCTPIQAETLPIALKGLDVAGQAQTGTGKTAAFLLATYQHLLSNPAKSDRKPNQPRALIVAPTRELAVQIHKDAEVLGKHTGLKLGLVFGGTGYEQQRQQLEDGVDILIGTPGRLIDYLKQHIYNLKAIQVVVMDEADRMFDLGFIKDIRFMLRRCPPPQERLGLLFSATLSFRVLELAYEHMNNPATIKIETDKVTADKVKQVCYMTANDEKISLLLGLLKRMDAHRTIVFVNTKRGADLVWGYLEGNGIGAAVISGDVPQKKRMRLLSDFQEGKLPVLVATDVAARGLHIPAVSHVFNFDLPDDAEDYVHRIGRTARAGASGDAISFACETHAFALPDIEAYIGHRIPMEPVTTELLATVDPKSRIIPDRPERDKRRGSSSRPPHKSKATNTTPSEGSGDVANKKRRRRRKPKPATTPE